MSEKKRRMKPEELREWRRKRKLSQFQLAGLLGVTQEAISHWETEKRKIPPFLDLALKTLEKEGWVEKARKGKFPPLKRLNKRQLKVWRKKHGLTQNQLANLLGVSYGAISGWEIGRRKIPTFLFFSLKYLENNLLD